ncbi:hypothetical protein PM082_007220 [Marasmius tenuissimus]|nr:hypothetical protein PM082_007220 [Marasmius tenuissimus]
MASQLLMRVFEARLHCNLDADLKVLVAKVISDIPYTTNTGDSDAGYMWSQLKRGFIDTPSEYLLMEALSLILERIQMPFMHHGAILPLDEPVTVGAGIEKTTMIRKRLVLAHDRSRLFGTHSKEAYFQMMEDYIVTFLAEVIDYHLPFRRRPDWALYDLHSIKSNFLQLFAVSSSKSPSERLLELHAFIQKNITEFASLRYNLSLTVFVGMESSQGECLDQIGRLFRDLNHMARCDSSAYFEVMEQDIVRWYTQTAGVCIDFLANELEREIWIEEFEPETDAAVFVVPLAMVECEQLVSGDASVNWLENSLELFRSICAAHRTPAKSPVNTLPLTLVFSHQDLRFTDKLQSSPLRAPISIHGGEQDMSATYRYIKDRFLECVRPDQDVSVRFIPVSNPGDVNDLFLELETPKQQHNP